MSHGAIVVYTKSIASNITNTGGIDLSRAWRNVYLEIPTMTSGTDLYLQASSNNSTFRRVFQRVNTATAQAAVVSIRSSVTNCLVDIPGGNRYVAIELSTAMTASTATFKLICSD
jgi:hypothetical protein